MRGSWLIKAVLPTLPADLDYATLDGVQPGLEVPDLYVETLDSRITMERRAEIRQATLAYCAHDALAMAVVLERLSGGEQRQFS